jgi:hypothetical protein
MTRLPFLIAALLLLGSLTAQTSLDALRYSTFDIYGSARFAGTAGAMTPLGTDVSVMSTNPAGIAWYRSGELSVTPGFEINQVDAVLRDGGAGPLANSENKFSFPSLGLVVSGQNRTYGAPTINFGVGVNRLANFNESFTYEGSTPGSIVKLYQQQANAGFFGLTGSDLAVSAEALIQDETTGEFFTDFDGYEDQSLGREETVTRSGQISELSFALGVNVKDRVMVGLALGVPFLDFDETKVYSEFNEFDNELAQSPFDDLRRESRISATGTGVNAKLGVIIRPVHPVRISLAVHTPTRFTIQEAFSASLAYNYTLDETPLGGFAQVPDEDFTYDFRTPWHFEGGLGYLVGRSGFLAVNVEYNQYNKSEFVFDDFPEDAEFLNRNIANELKSSLGVRVGGELAIEKYRFRAGAGLRQLGAIVPAVANSSDWIPTLGGGAGVRFNRVALEATYQYRGFDGSYSPYDSEGLPLQLVDQNFTSHRLFFTLGVRL